LIEAHPQVSPSLGVLHSSGGREEQELLSLVVNLLNL
jgi:hypothetical protein